MNIANMITASRMLWLVIFIWAVQAQHFKWAALMFLAAWGLDAVDGWVARRLGQVTRLGYVLDKAVDRTVLIVGVLVLLMHRVVPDYAILILTKEIAALPVTTAQLRSTNMIRSMGKGGKLVVVGQGVAVGWLWAGLPGGWLVVMLVAVLGAVVSGKYVFDVYYGGDDV
jgi:phosphatidylglycerophosphate synthase